MLSPVGGDKGGPHLVDVVTDSLESSLHLRGEGQSAGIGRLGRPGAAQSLRMRFRLPLRIAAFS